MCGDDWVEASGATGKRIHQRQNRDTSLLNTLRGSNEQDS